GSAYGPDSVRRREVLTLGPRPRPAFCYQGPCSLHVRFSATVQMSSATSDHRKRDTLRRHGPGTSRSNRYANEQSDLDRTPSARQSVRKDCLWTARSIARTSL